MKYDMNNMVRKALAEYNLYGSSDRYGCRFEADSEIGIIRLKVCDRHTDGRYDSPVLTITYSFRDGIITRTKSVGL